MASLKMSTPLLGSYPTFLVAPILPSLLGEVVLFASAASNPFLNSCWDGLVQQQQERVNPMSHVNSRIIFHDSECSCAFAFSSICKGSNWRAIGSTANKKCTLSHSYTYSLFITTSNQSAPFDLQGCAQGRWGSCKSVVMSRVTPASVITTVRITPPEEPSRLMARDTAVFVNASASSQVIPDLQFESQNPKM